jgi:MFS family permease
MSLIRWPAVLVGFLVAALLGMLLGTIARQAAGVDNPGTLATLEFVALVAGGYVAGRLAGRVGVMQGVAVAAIFILVAASIKAWWEIDLASRFGPHVLGPMDMGGLILGDLVHLAGACVGGWLSDLGRPAPERPQA